MAEKDEIMLSHLIAEMPERLNFRKVLVSSSRYEISETVLKNLEDGLHHRLEKLAGPSVFHFFLEYLMEKDMLDPYLENPEAAVIDPFRTSFLDEITADGCAVLKKRLPAFVRLFCDRRKQYQLIMDELFERLDEAYEELSEKLFDGRAFQRILEVHPDSGDLHHNGRCTMVIATDAGKMVYKPHDVGIDECTAALFSRFFSDALKAPKVFSGNGYGFVEFIESKPADTDEKARGYFHNLGGLSAVIQLLGSTDLHHNNVLSNGIYPVIIDYELMVTPGKGYPKNSPAYELDHSLFFSSLMPLRRGHTELSILFARDEENRSSPVVNGERKCVIDYPDEFMDGYQEMYHRCMKIRNELKEYSDTLKGVRIRHIYRNTKTYHDLLMKILEPGWMENPELGQELKKNLSLAMEREGRKADEKIIEAEMESLLRGDIPYFYTFADSHDLYASERTAARNFFPVSCVERLQEELLFFSEADLNFEKALLAKSMTKVIRRNNHAPDTAEPVIGQRDFENEKLLKLAEDLFQAIEKDAVKLPSGRMLWFGPNYFLETGMNILNDGYMDGTAGLAVFFAAVARFTQNPAIRDRSCSLLNDIWNRLEHRMEAYADMEVIPAAVQDISLTQGFAGKLLACHLIRFYTRDNRYLKTAEKIIAAMQKADLRFEGSDVYQGLAGALKVLCSHDDIYALAGVPQLASLYADRLLSMADIPYQKQKLWRTLSPSWAISGAGHGQSGIACALSITGKRLGRQDLLDAAETGFAFENSIYSLKTGTWPDRRGSELTEEYLSGYCSGAPGIGINALEAPSAFSDSIVKRAVRAVLREPLLYKDFLCCGNSAVIEFLLQAGLYDEARTRAAMMSERAVRNGHFNCLSPNVQEIFSPSLFYGAAGIGYEMLRIMAPDQTLSAYP